MPPPTSTPAPIAWPTARKAAALGDNGDPVSVLREKGIAKANKTNLRALVNVLKGFEDFRSNGKLLIKEALALQLVAVTKLLDEAITENGTENDSRPAMKGDLKQAVNSIKAAAGPLPMSQSAALSFADMVRAPASSMRMAVSFADMVKAPASSMRMAVSRPLPSAEAQEKDIFVSLKNASPGSTFVTTLVTELTGKCNELLTMFFKDPKNGGIDLPSLLRSTSRLPNNNIILSFKLKDNTTRARVHTEDWVKNIDPAAAVPQCTYTVVAHNIPAAVWSNPVML